MSSRMCAAACAFLFLIVPMRTAAGGLLPNYAVQVGHGRILGSPWRVWIFGSSTGARCIGASVVSGEFGTQTTACGSGVPPAYWERPLQIVTGAGAESGSVLFLFAQRTVGWINVLMETGRGQFHWRQQRVKRFSRYQAEQAHLRADFSYSIQAFQGHICVKRVVALDQSGKRVERSPLLFCHPVRP